MSLFFGLTLNAQAFTQISEVYPSYNNNFKLLDIHGGVFAYYSFDQNLNKSTLNIVELMRQTTYLLDIYEESKNKVKFYIREKSEVQPVNSPQQLSKLEHVEKPQGKIIGQGYLLLTRKGTDIAATMTDNKIYDCLAGYLSYNYKNPTHQQNQSDLSNQQTQVTRSGFISR